MNATLQKSNTAQIVAKMSQIRDELNSFFLERKAPILASHVAILSKKHVVFFGLPGTAKSALIMANTRHIKDSLTFVKMITPTTTQDETEGNIDVPKMMATGEFRRRRIGKMTKSHFVFLDEIFKGNSMLLNANLQIINERVYEEEGKLEPCPLITMFGASNELPQGPELNAFYDRFSFRFDFKYLSPKNRAGFLSRPLGYDYATCVPNPTMITLDEIKQLQAEVKNVNFTLTAVEQLSKIFTLTDQNGLTPSDRGMLWIKEILAAHAVLHGRDQVTEEDFGILEHVLWSDPADKSKVKSILNQVGSPVKAKSLEILDAARSDYDNTIQVAGQNPGQHAQKVSESLKTLEKTQKELITLCDNNPGNPHPVKAMDKLDLMIDNLARLMRLKPVIDLDLDD